MCLNTMNPGSRATQSGDAMPKYPATRTAADDPGALSIRAIARAAEVLRALEGARDGLSLGQISLRVGLPRSTVQRIVDSLRPAQFVMCATPGSGVRLCVALIQLAAAAKVDFDRTTRPIVAALSRLLGETVELSALTGRRALLTDQVQGPRRLRAVSSIGATLPLHCTANGKALLTVVTSDQCRDLIRAPLESLTPQSIIDPVRLQAEIAAGQRTGLVLEEEEYTAGLSAIGTGFMDATGRPIALSIPMPTRRFTLCRAALASPLLDARARLLSALGAPPAVYR